MKAAEEGRTAAWAMNGSRQRSEWWPAASCSQPGALSDAGCQPGQPRQVVRRSDQVAGVVHALQMAVAGLAEAAHGFHPAEDLLHPFANSLADRVARPTGGPPVDGTAPPTADVLGHMRRHLLCAQRGHTVLGVVALVR